MRLQLLTRIPAAARAEYSEHEVIFGWSSGSNGVAGKIRLNAVYYCGTVRALQADEFSVQAPPVITPATFHK